MDYLQLVFVFTAYGPWGRPEWLFLIYKKYFRGRSIDVYNNGNCKRDFTFIDDVIESIIRLMKKVPMSDFNMGISSLLPLQVGPLLIYLMWAIHNLRFI